MAEKTGKKITRRQMGQLMAGAMLSAAFSLPGRGRAEDELAGTEAEVVLTGVPAGAGEEAVSQAVRKAAEAVTDFSWLRRGNTVLLKPAVNSGKPYPATTCPTAIRAMIELLKEKGAGRVLVCDLSGIEWVKLTPRGMVKGSTRELMHRSGLAQAVLAAGGELYLPEENGGWEAYFEEEPRQGGSWKRGIMMPRIVQEADHIVLMPRCARHVLAGSTLGFKAAVGWWRTDTRLEYHHDASTLPEKTAEANTVPSLLEKQRLVLTTATRVLTTFGPDNGWIHEPETGLIIASSSLLAHDMVSLAWLIRSREFTPAGEKNWLKDPHSSQFMAANGNRLVVGAWLAGPKEAMTSETLVRFDLNTIWDCRILRRAFQIFGGIPGLRFIVPDDSVPPELVKELIRRTTSQI